MSVTANIENILNHLEASSNEDFVLLNDNLQKSGLLAIGKQDELIGEDHQNGNLDNLEKFLAVPHSWKFGYVSYDLKNEIEQLTSQNKDVLEFPIFHFFIPKTVFALGEKANNLVFGEDINWSEKKIKNSKSKAISLSPSMSNDEYLNAIHKIKGHIQQGDLYETNFCYEFSAREEINPFDIYRRLNNLTSAPFSVFAKLGDKYIISGSPERYVKKTGSTLISQPIKGTASRSNDPKLDEEIRLQLLNDPKERTENTMIVDLVRNDLSRIAKKGSVKVDEFCKTHSFKTVHQLISTISCEVDPGTSFTEVLRATFPMGSMTGAPKIASMQLMEQYESSRRGALFGNDRIFNTK